MSDNIRESRLNDDEKKDNNVCTICYLIIALVMIAGGTYCLVDNNINQTMIDIELSLPFFALFKRYLFKSKNDK